MTVTYTGEVATCRGLGCFLKLLRRWRGSIYKLVWIDLLCFLTVYYLLNFIYRFALTDDQRRFFEKVVRYCHEYGNLIPLSFVLGFYVSIVMTRWWHQYTTIPFPDPLAVFVSATIHGQDERGRVMRRTIMRYVCCCVTMIFTMIAPKVKKRFPTLNHFVEAGLLQQNEKDILANLDSKFPKYNKYWLPIVWAASIITRARKEGRIRDDFAVKTLIDELNKFRGQCGLLMAYDTISIPLVYTQVVTLAVYSYFITAIVAHQWVEVKNDKFDLYFPIFTTLQFFFYMGWLKVAETLINPFGDDDDDFEINWMVDRNLQVSYLIVDEMHHEHPELVRDQYWDEVFPQELPYTLAAEPFRESHPEPSTANIAVKHDDAEIVGPPQSVKIDDASNYYNNDMNSAPITFTAKDNGGMSRRSRGSQSSMGQSRGSQSSMSTSVPDSSMPRVASVTKVLKRMFSKEDGKGDNKDVKPDSRNSSSMELNQIGGGSVSRSQQGTKRITDQVIEEVDEQMTITSQHNANETRPSVMQIFGPPPPSKPISVPTTPAGQMSSEPSSFGMSKSAPAAPDMEELKDKDTISIGGSDTDHSDDEFTRLKNVRQAERLSRLKINLAKSLGKSDPDQDSELLLENASPELQRELRSDN